jgi:hypothetical protein
MSVRRGYGRIESVPEEDKPWGLITVLYAGYALMLILSAALFVDAVFFLLPPLTVGDTPAARVILIAVVAPVLMLALAAGALLPGAIRTARGGAPGASHEALAGAAGGYVSCLVIIAGFSIASVLLTLPVILVRALFFR